MATIPMTSGFVLIPEGTYIFKVVEAKYNEEFGKIEIKLETEKGLNHTERFSIKNADDSYNDKALNAFSYFAKTVMNDFTIKEIEPEDLVGHYIQAEVVHTVLPSNKDANKTITFANLGDKAPASGFEETYTEQVKSISNLDELLGD